MTTPTDPDLAADLDHLAARRRIHLIRLPENRGFPSDPIDSSKLFRDRQGAVR